jgi:CheY-like chemotaxis protein
MPMATVLVIEDDPKSRKLLVDVLTAQGVVVVQAEAGEEAVALARAHAPELVLLDIHLPGIDGFATLQRLREAAGLAPLAVVAVTASVMSGDQTRLRQAGFDGVLPKPVRLDALRAVVRAHCNLGQLPFPR